MMKFYGTKLSQALFAALVLSLSGCGYYSFSPKGDEARRTGLLKNGALIATGFAMMSNTEVVDAGICTPMKIMATGPGDVEAPVINAQSFDVSIQGSTGVQTYSDPACTTPASRFTIPAGGTSVTFYVKTTDGNSFSPVAINRAGLGFISRRMSVVRNPQGLIFTRVPSNANGGFCSGEISVEVRDGLNAAVNTTMSLALASTHSTMEFFSDAACSTANKITSLSFNNTSSRSFYYRDMDIDNNVRLTVTPSLSRLSPLQSTVNILNAPYQLVFESPAGDLTLGLVSANPFKLRVRNSENADVSSGPNRTVNLSLAAGAAADFCADAACANVLGNSINLNNETFRDIFVRPRDFPTLQLRATSANLQAATSMAKTVQRVPTNYLIAVEGGNNVASAQCTRITVTMRDGVNNPFNAVANTTLTIEPAASADRRYYKDDNCTNEINAGNALAISAGQAAVDFYFRDNEEASHQVALRVSSADPAISGTQIINVARDPLKLDRVYGNSGVQGQTVDAGASDEARAVAFFDGGVILVGTSRLSGQDRLSAIKLNGLGDLATGFDGDGKLAYTGCTGGSRGNAVVVQGTEFLAAGSCDGDALVLRYNASGNLVGSPAVVDFGGTDEAFGIAVDGSGNIFIAALVNNAGTRGIGLAKLDSDGNEIRKAVSTAVTDLRRVEAIALQGTEILVAGARNNGDDEAFVARFLDNANFDIDDTFAGTTGIFIADVGSGDDAFHAMKLVDVGGSQKILAVGTTGSDFLLARLNADGSSDNAFDSDGLATFGNATAETAFAVDTYKDNSGTFLVVGRRVEGGNPRWLGVRFNASGATDGSNFLYEQNHRANSADAEAARGVVIGADGKAIVVGVAAPEQRAVRLLH